MLSIILSSTVNQYHAGKLGFKSHSLHFYLFLQEKNIVLITNYTLWSEKRDLNPKLLINFYLTLLTIKKKKRGEGFGGSFLILVKTVEETVTEGMKSE